MGASEKSGTSAHLTLGAKKTRGVGKGGRITERLYMLSFILHVTDNVTMRSRLSRPLIHRLPSFVRDCLPPQHWALGSAFSYHAWAAIGGADALHAGTAGVALHHGADGLASCCEWSKARQRAPEADESCGFCWLHSRQGTTQIAWA